jgi:adenine-specific DNA-methyltransferase
MPKNDYSSWPREDLIKKIKALEKRKKYGLVWDSVREPEQVVLGCQRELPVLKEDKTKEIITNPNEPTHILIEGDNYHALSVLNYTHEKAIDVIYIDPPFNTGAKDWKYNNNYVDINDSYRHSKWLSMMSNRLTLAKGLLKHDGVLICAIDDNELNRLGLLLEGIFTNYEIHCITIVHNPRGIQGKNFSYTHEYAYFVFRQGVKVIGVRKIKEEDMDWRNLRDNGGESLRTDAKNCFYPIIIEHNKVIGFGDVLSPELHPEAQTVKIDGEYLVFPIDRKGVERKWRYARQSVEEIKDLLRAKRTKSGYEIEIGKNFGTVRTVWQDSRYDANEYGTKLVHEIAPESNFDFPKSIWNTYDCIAPVLDERKEAVILDFFAGSGTTGHALMLLNSEDGGKRQFILCTNNENNIATDVCHPRIKNVIKGYKDSKGDNVTGLGSNLKYFITSFVPAAPTDRNKELLTAQSIEMLTLKEGTFEKVTENPSYVIYRNSDKYTGIIFDQLSFTKFKKEINGVNEPVSLYIFSLADEDFSDDFADMKDIVRICAIPEAILRVYRRIFK